MESGVGFVKKNFLPGRKFTDYGDLNRQAIEWCNKKNGRIHGTTGERPVDRLKEENLKPLPAPDTYHKFIEEERQVYKDGLLSFDGVMYGVPWKYSGKKVIVREKDGRIEILCGGEIIAVHEKRYRAKSTVFLKDQYRGLKDAEGMIYPRPAAIRVLPLEVEKRSLGVYQRLLEAGET